MLFYQSKHFKSNQIFFKNHEGIFSKMIILRMIIFGIPKNALKNRSSIDF